MVTGSTTETNVRRRLLPGDPTTVLSGVGPAVAARLGAAGIATLRDLILFFPRRYREVLPLECPDEEALGEWVRIGGRIASVRRQWLPGRRSLVLVELACADGTPLVLPFFNQPYLKKSLVEGGERLAEGVLDRRGGKFALKNPRFAAGGGAESRVQLRYPEIEGVSENRLRALIDAALAQVDQSALSLPKLPAGLGALVPDRKLPLGAMHRPTTVAEHEGARRHFALHEAVALFRRLESARRGRAQRRGPEVVVDDTLRGRIAARIPFQWTGDQAAAVAFLEEKMAGPAPMGVLLQGDVGTGKTAVAMAAALAVIARGHQVAFLAPTELLAEQHAASLAPWLRESRVRTALLTAGQPGGERRAVEQAVASGVAQLVLGTHALFSDRTRFHSLGLCIVDEQHRFGVEQRMRLLGKGRDPHVLVMTATPIPRTLAITLLGDLDLVTLRERPPGRRPSPALFVPRQQWSKVLRAISRRVGRGQRCFVVCSKIGEGGAKGGAVFVEHELARRFRTGLVHGRMPAVERQAVTEAFRRGDLDVLVGTTVLEVGIDVAAATLMVVVGCDRYGLATLHQLRGRVGRGGRRGLCLVTGERTARTAALCRTTDGFELAEEDLRLRGMGEFFGTRQSGVGDLRALDVIADRELVLQVRDAVRGEP